MGNVQAKYKCYLVSVFMEEFIRIGQKLHKITNNSMKYKGSALIFTNLVRIYPRHIHTKFKENLWRGLREFVEKVKIFTTKDTGWLLESHSFSKCD